MTRNRLTLPVVVVTIFAIVAVIVATNSGAKKTSHRTVAGGWTISLAHTPVGNALVDGNGRTLYLFAGDKPNVSRLSAAGQAVWPPLTSITLPATAGGVSARGVGTIAASDQITYNGHPLYYYIGDRHTGQAAGQGLNQFGARWYVVSGRGAAITSAASTGSASQSAPGPSNGAASGYGY